MKKKIITTALTASIVLMNAGNAAVSFMEDFDSNAIGSNFVVTDSTQGTGLGNPTFDTGAAVFPEAGDDGRAYLGTTFTDFTDASFSASVDYTITNLGGGSVGFFGLGPGTTTSLNADNSGSSFGEPSDGPVAYVLTNGTGRANGTITANSFANGVTNGNTGNADGLNLDTIFTPGAGTHTLLLDFDVGTGDIVFSIDQNGAGTITELGSFNTADFGTGFDDTNSRIFFGGSDGTIFDNFEVTVVPEPSSTLILGAAGIIGLVRRRR